MCLIWLFFCSSLLRNQKYHLPLLFLCRHSEWALNGVMTSWNYHFTVNVLYSVFTMWVQSPVMCPSKLDSAVSFTADRMLMQLPCYVCDFIEHTRANNQTQNLWHCFQHTGNNSKKSVMLRIIVYDNHVSYNAVCSTWLTPRRQLLCL